MAWSTRIARIAGIDIRVHVTFAFALVLGALIWGRDHGAAGALFGMLMIALLFVCITLHELGHSLAARAVGIPTREIVLLPIGGVALLARNPSKPTHELFITAAGPIVNIMIAAVLLVFGAATGAFAGLEAGALFSTLSASAALAWLVQANIALALFNMIPAFPLDGGRILRAGLALRFDERTATRIATYTGQTIAIALGVFALMSGQILLAVIAVLIYLGAGQERADGQVRGVLSQLRVGEIYNRQPVTLPPTERISSVAHAALGTRQRAFVVASEGQPQGLLTYHDVMRALQAGQADRSVAEIMRRDMPSVQSDATLEEARELMQTNNATALAVVSDTTFRGLITAEDIAEAAVVTELIGRNRTPQTTELAR